MKKFAPVLLLLVLAACSSRTVATPTAAQPTEMATALQASPTTEPTKTITPTHIPSATPIPTVTSTPPPSPTITLSITPNLPPTEISTPLAPLTFHTWNPQTVLVLYSTSGGDGSSPFQSPPHLVLYADGSLFVTKWIEVKSQYKKQVVTKKLELAEMCAFLNTIDRTDYLNYDPRSYSKNQYGKELENYAISGSSTTELTVQTWGENTGSYYGLFSFLLKDYYFPICQDFCEYVPTISQPLLDTYLLLSNYEPSDMEIFQPTQIEMWVRVPLLGSSDRVWPLTDIKLSDLENFTPATFEGELAVQVYDIFNQTIEPYGIQFTESDTIYEVFVRPVFPYPWDTNETYPGIPDQITCTPEDGTLPIPTPWQ